MSEAISEDAIDSFRAYLKSCNKQDKTIECLVAAFESPMILVHTTESFRKAFEHYFKGWIRNTEMLYAHTPYPFSIIQKAYWITEANRQADLDNLFAN